MEHLDQANYVRFAYDDEKNIIAFEFLKEETVSTECFKLNKVVTLSSLLNYCNINIKDIAGVYSKNAIEGPVDIPGFSKNAYLIYINKREIPVKKVSSKDYVTGASSSASFFTSSSGSPVICEICCGVSPSAIAFFASSTAFSCLPLLNK